MKEIELRNVKGCVDYSPREQYIRNYISDTLKKVFEKYGFKPLQTPLLCYYDLLALKYDEENDILKEVYKVTDQGNRNLALRYDLTVPFAKYIAMNPNTKMPFKRYEIGEVFRNGPVKLGRDREFIQCDVDSVGIEGQLTEAEFVALYVEAYNKLNIDIVIKYNNRKFLSGIIIEAGIAKELVTDTITIIDKFEKMTRQELEKEFAKIGLNNEQIEKLFTYLNMDASQLINIESKNEVLSEGINELNTLKEYIEKLGLIDYVQFSPSLARGQEYYTGTVFEVYVKDGSITSSIGGGGRYDKMITDFIGNGTKYPAVGVSFGLNVIYEILKDREEFAEKAKNNFTILLHHQPEYIAEDAKKTDIDLIVCGHTHGGQIQLPFIGGVIAPNQGLFPKYDKGEFDLDGTKMIVCAGLSNTVFIPRINNQVEIGVVTVV